MQLNDVTKKKAYALSFAAKTTKVGPAEMVEFHYFYAGADPLTSPSIFFNFIILYSAMLGHDCLSTNPLS